MSDTECFQALGVAPHASWEEVRRAYKDLVRVWHPDRFESDPQLREKAEQQLQKINEAYFALKSSHIFVGRRPEPPPQTPPPRTPPPPKPPADADAAASVHPRPRRRMEQLLWDLQVRWPAKALWLAWVCLTPVVVAGLLINALRVPALDSVLTQGSLPRPALLTPSRVINPFGDKSVTADALSNWAREGVDLWRSLPKIGENSPEPRTGATSDRVPPKDDAVPPAQQRHRDIAAAAPVMPVNGTELLWTRRSGAGELWVSNETGRDAFATLVQANTAAPLRAIYIQARNKVCMRNVAPGLYDLLAEVGENWDPNHIRFRAARQPLGRSGPFDFFDVTSTQGTSGRRFDVVLRTQ